MINAENDSLQGKLKLHSKKKKIILSRKVTETHHFQIILIGNAWKKTMKHEEFEEL